MEDKLEGLATENEWPEEQPTSALPPAPLGVDQMEIEESRLVGGSSEVVLTTNVNTEEGRNGSVVKVEPMELDIPLRRSPSVSHGGIEDMSEPARDPTPSLDHDVPTTAQNSSVPPPPKTSRSNSRAGTPNPSVKSTKSQPSVSRSDIDFRKRCIEGYTELTIIPLSADLDVIRLNCRQCEILKVLVNEIPAKFQHVDPLVSMSKPISASSQSANGSESYHPEFKEQFLMSMQTADEGELTIERPPAVEIEKMDGVSVNENSESTTNIDLASGPGDQFLSSIVVRVYYRLLRPVSGAYFVLPDRASAPKRYAHMFVYNQVCSARLWLPCIDHHKERCTWEFEIRVDRTHQLALGCESVSGVTEVSVEENRSKRRRTLGDQSVEDIFEYAADDSEDDDRNVPNDGAAMANGHANPRKRSIQQGRTQSEDELAQLSKTMTDREMMVVCGGELVETISLPKSNKRIFYYVLDQMTAAPSITLAAGPFEVVPIPKWGQSNWDSHVVPSTTVITTPAISDSTFPPNFMSSMPRPQQTQPSVLMPLPGQTQPYLTPLPLGMMLPGTSAAPGIPPNMFSFPFSLPPGSLPPSVSGAPPLLVQQMLAQMQMGARPGLPMSLPLGPPIVTPIPTTSASTRPSATPNVVPMGLMPFMPSGIPPVVPNTTGSLLAPPPSTAGKAKKPTLDVPSVVKPNPLKSRPDDGDPSKGGYAFCLPGRKDQLVFTVSVLHMVLEFFQQYIGSSFPYSSFKAVFIEDAYNTFSTGATMGIFGSHLLHGPEIIDQAFETRRVLCRAVATQWFGHYIAPKAWADIWLITGLANYMTSLFLRKHFGNNEFRYRMHKDMQRVCALDVNQPALYPNRVGEDKEKEGSSGGSSSSVSVDPLHIFHYHPDDESGSLRTELISLKSPIVLHMLDRRMGGKGHQILKVVNKVLVSALSGELPLGLSTHHFLKVCRKVCGNIKESGAQQFSPDALRAFANQWIYSSGVPRFGFSYRFSRRKMIVEILFKQENTNAGHPGAAPLFNGPLTIRIHEPSGTFDTEVMLSDAEQRLEIQYHSKYKRVRRAFGDRVRGGRGSRGGRGGRGKGKVGGGKDGGSSGLNFGEDDDEEDDDDDGGPEEGGNTGGARGDDRGAQESVDRLTFEWIRLDPDNDWLCEKSFEQMDFMWMAQLQKDRDVVAQYEAVQALYRMPTVSSANALYSIMTDPKTYFRIRCDAAHALVSCATESLNWIGLNLLLRAYHDRHLDLPALRPPPLMNALSSFSSTLSSIFSSTGIPSVPSLFGGARPLGLPLQQDSALQEFPGGKLDVTSPMSWCMPKPNQFESFQEYFVQKAIAGAIATVRDSEGLTPTMIRRFVLDLLKFNDNEGNAYSDCFFVSELILRLGSCFLPSYLIPSLVKAPRPVLLKGSAVSGPGGNGPSGANGILSAGSNQAKDQSEIVDLNLDFLEEPSSAPSTSREESRIRGATSLSGSIEHGATTEGLGYYLPVRTYFGTERDLELFRLAIKAVERQMNRDLIMPSYHNVLTASGLQVLLRWSLAGLIPIDFPVFLLHSRYGSFLHIRLAAFDALIVLGLLKREILLYLVGVIREDPCSYVRYYVARSLSAILIVAMHSGPATAAAAIGAPVDSQSLRHTEGADAAQKSSSIDAGGIGNPSGWSDVKKSLGAMPQVKAALWDLLNSRYTAYDHRLRIHVLQICDILHDHPVEKTSVPKLRFKMSISRRAMEREEESSASEDEGTTKSGKVVVLEPAKVQPTKAQPAKSKSSKSAKKGIDYDSPAMQQTLSSRPINPKFVALGNELLNRLRNHGAAARFMVPVDELQAPNYYKMIKKPMDLMTMGKKLAAGSYGNELPALIADVRRIFSNCFAYNEDDSLVYNQGKRLQSYFEEEILPMVQSGLGEAGVTSTTAPKLVLKTGSKVQNADAGGVKKAVDVASDVVMVQQPSSSDTPNDSNIPVDVDAGTGPEPAIQPTTQPATHVEINAGRLPSANTSGGGAVPDSPAKTKSKDQDKQQKAKEKRPKAVSSPSVSKPETSEPKVEVQTGNLAPNDAKNCKRILKEIMKHPSARWFIVPVDPVALGIPTYLSIIKNPMDLSTVKSKLDKGSYSNPSEFESDMRLIFNNAMTFNPPLTKVHIDAKVVLGAFESQLTGAPSKISTSTSIPQQAPTVITGLSSGDKKRCERVLKAVMAQPCALHFLAPVDTNMFPEYRKLVEAPMDLGTMLAKVQSDAYTAVDGLVEDVKLMIKNCYTFNLAGTWICNQADEVGQAFNKEWGSRAIPPGTELVAMDTNKKDSIGSRASSAAVPLKEAADGKKAKKVLQKVQKHKASSPFLQPVDPIALGIPTYFQIIKRPMDLSTVDKKFEDGTYKTLDEMVADFRLMFDNCYLFNADPLSPVHVLGRQLESVFEKEWIAQSLPLKERSGSIGPSSSQRAGKPTRARISGVDRARVNAMLEKLRTHPDALYFLEPVDDTILPDYRIKIKNPIDLRTMQTKVDGGDGKSIQGYSNIPEFEADMKLLFSNCYSYNAKHSQGYMCGASLEKFFKKEWGSTVTAATGSPAGSEKSGKLKLSLGGPGKPVKADSPLTPRLKGSSSTPTLEKGSGTPIRIKLGIKSSGSDVGSRGSSASKSKGSTAKRDGKVSSGSKGGSATASPSMSVSVREPVVQARCIEALQKLIEHPFSAPFLQPVPRETPGYHALIKKPMDLGTIMKKLRAGGYKNADDVFADVELVWKNCQTYNAEGSEYYVRSQTLDRFFRQGWSEALDSGTDGHEGKSTPGGGAGVVDGGSSSVAAPTAASDGDDGIDDDGDGSSEASVHSDNED